MRSSETSARTYLRQHQEGKCRRGNRTTRLAHARLPCLVGIVYWRITPSHPGTAPLSTVACAYLFPSLRLGPARRDTDVGDEAHTAARGPPARGELQRVDEQRGGAVGPL